MHRCIQARALASGEASLATGKGRSRASDSAVDEVKAEQAACRDPVSKMINKAIDTKITIRAI